MQGLTQEGPPTHREADPLQKGRPLTGRMDLCKEAWHITGMPGLSQGGQASCREAIKLTGRKWLSQEGQPLTGKPGHLQGGPASHR